MGHSQFTKSEHISVRSCRNDVRNRVCTQTKSAVEVLVSKAIKVINKNAHDELVITRVLVVSHSSLLPCIRTNYFILRNEFNLAKVGFIPFLAVPATMDYLKRDYYVSMFVKEKKELCQAQRMVKQIVEEKK
jgi:hypothetical protein